MRLRMAVVVIAVAMMSCESLDALFSQKQSADKDAGEPLASTALPSEAGPAVASEATAPHSR